MDYLIEANKFIQRARQADVAEVIQAVSKWLSGCFPERSRNERTRRPRASQVKPRDTHYLRPLAE